MTTQYLQHKNILIQTLPKREFDADKAKFHWGKTGLGDTPITCHASGASLDGSVDVALLLQASAKITWYQFRSKRRAK